MLMLCCFTADQYPDHSRDDNYRAFPLGAEDPLLPWNQHNSKAFDIFVRRLWNSEKQANRQNTVTVVWNFSCFLLLPFTHLTL